MASNSEIHSYAISIVSVYGGGAETQASKRMDVYRSLGYAEGVTIWRKIREKISELQKIEDQAVDLTVRCR